MEIEKKVGYLSGLVILAEKSWFFHIHVYTYIALNAN